MIQEPNSNALLADEMISTELARANLARLRGDYSTAEDQCTALLQKAPHNANVAALLGDVCAEQGKLEAAVQWYEMSIDSGAPAGIEDKLASTRNRIKQNEAVASEAGIGLPSRTAFSPASILAVVIVVLMLFVAAYIAGTNRTPTKQVVSQDQPPIFVPSSSSGSAGNPNPTEPITSATNSPSPAESIPAADSHLSTAPSNKSTVDADLAPFFGDANGPLARVSNASSDPRSHVVYLDVPLQPGDDPRAVAAQLVEAALGKMKDALLVTIRIMNVMKPEFVADGTREKYEAYLRTGHTAGTGAELADALLSNEWRTGSETAATGR